MHRPSLILSLLAITCVSCAADSELTPAEASLVELMNDYYADLEVYWNQDDRYETREAYLEARMAGEIVDPNAEYIPRLLEFEAAHRGDDVGLLALWHVFKEAGRGGLSDSPAVVGRRDAVTRLAPYAESELLPLALRAALFGNYDSSVHASLAAFAESHPSTAGAAFARYGLASECFELQRARSATKKRLDALRAGADPRWGEELAYVEESFSGFPTVEELDAQGVAAIETLEALAADAGSPRVPGVEGVDEKWRVVRVFDDPEQPLLSERAAAVLFKERHLQIGAVAPDLEVTLIGGAPWRMADQRGRVVVVQFSFTGCGPCERMYPDLAELTTEHGERLSILTLMRDAEPDDADEGVASGKLTWSVALDGKPGRVSQEWSVDGFPEVYVIDREGRITARGLRGDELRKEIAQLLAAKS